MPVALYAKSHKDELEMPSDSLRVTVSSESGDRTASCDIFLFGAHVTSWVTNGRERLWMSTLSPKDGRAPIRGGIPIAFPQFADAGPLKLHGFVREKVWEVTSRIDSLEETTLTPRARILTDVRRNPFGKSNSESETVVLEYENTIGNIDYREAFRLTMTIQLNLDSLTMTLDVVNLGEDDMHFTGCLHPYFRTEDINNVSIQGLAGLTYIDKVDGYKEKLLNPSAPYISIAEEVLSFVPDSESAVEQANYFVDRIFKHPEETSLSLRLIDRNIGDVLEIIKSTSWPNWVIFNPWIEGKKGAKGPDFDDDGYKFMICVEPAAALRPIVLKELESWKGAFTLSIRQI